MSVSDDDIVALGLLDYFDRLKVVFELTPKRTIANYLIWRSVLSASKYLNKELYQRKMNFSTILHGVQKQSPRHIECVAYTTEQ